MSADTWAVVIVAAAGVFYTLFTIGYLFTVRWWMSLSALALAVSSTSLTLLINISLLYQAFGDSYYLRDAVRLTVYSLIAFGGLLKLAALFWSKFTRRGEPDRFTERRDP